MAAITATFAPIPASLCGRPFSEIWPILGNLIVFNLDANIRNYNFGPTTPPAEKQGDPWLKTDSLFKPERWYVFSGGVWIARHGLAPGIIALYMGTEVSVPTFDGGSGGTIVDVTESSGPMWLKADEFNARVPVGTGAGTAPTSLVLSPGDNGGFETHTLTIAELPPHTHDVKIPQDTAVDTNQTLAIQGDNSLKTTVVSEATGGGTAHNNLQPYTGGVFIKRTARLFYRAI